MFFERLTRQPELYDKIIGISKDTLETISPRLKKLLRYQLAITTRWVITFVFLKKSYIEILKAT